MKISVKESGACRKTLKIEVDQAAVEAEHARVVSEFAKEARIPGFRKGKAPEQIVEKHYSSDVMEETKRRIIPDSYRSALSEKGIDPVAVVGIDDLEWDKGMPLKFSISVDVAPKFRTPRYKRMSIKGKKVEITDQEVDDTVNRLLENGAKYEDVTGRELRPGDMAQIDYTAESEGKPIGDISKDAAFLGKVNGYWLMLEDPEPIPGIWKSLVGATVDEEREVTVQFPDGFRVEAVQGLTAQYKVTVKAIREKTLPEIDDEFLKPFQVADEAELRAKIMEQTLEAKQGEEKQRQKDEIIKVLLDKTSFDVPESLVQAEARRIVQDVVAQNTARGASQEQIEEHKEDILTTATKSSHDRVKLSYIVERIADEESVEVSDTELEAHLEAMAARYRTDSKTLRAELEKRDELSSLISNIRADKALDHVLSGAKVKVK